MAMQSREGIVDRYFNYIRDLRSGSENAVDQLTELWDEEGVFEFAGAPPLVGTFVGRNAIRTLYSNRLKASGMPLAFNGQSDDSGLRDAALGMVETHVNRIRGLDREGVSDDPDRYAVGWTTIIGTNDERGFEVSGNHTFTFKGDRIASLKVVMSPKAEQADGLRLEGLTVDDIGRLSLAAWAVV